jgi:hypothetical protein
LNDAVNWKFSNFSTTVQPSIADNVCETLLGVREIDGAMATAAAATSSAASCLRSLMTSERERSEHVRSRP